MLHYAHENVYTQIRLRTTSLHVTEHYAFMTELGGKISFFTLVVLFSAVN